MKGTYDNGFKDGVEHERNRVLGIVKDSKKIIDKKSPNNEKEWGERDGGLELLRLLELVVKGLSFKGAAEELALEAAIMDNEEATKEE